MLAILKSRAFLALIGLLLLALLLWFAGPYFAFADHKPLETVVARLVAILVLVVVGTVVIQLSQLRSSRASNKIAVEVVAQGGAQDSAGGASPAVAPGSGADAAQLRKRFEEAVGALKKSRQIGRAHV